MSGYHGDPEHKASQKSQFIYREELKKRINAMAHGDPRVSFDALLRNEMIKQVLKIVDEL